MASKKHTRAGQETREPEIDHALRPLDFCEHGIAQLPAVESQCPWCRNQEPAAQVMAAFGWEDILQNVARKRGFWRNQDDLFDVVADLRLHLIHKQEQLAGYAAKLGWNSQRMAGMVGVICKRHIVGQQTHVVMRGGRKVRETKDAYLVRRSSVKLENAEGELIPWAGTTLDPKGRPIAGSGTRHTLAVGHDSVSGDDGPPSRYTAAQQTARTDDYGMRQAEAGVAAFHSSHDTRMPAIAAPGKVDVDTRHLDVACAMVRIPVNLRLAIETRFGTVEGNSATWADTAAVLNCSIPAARWKVGKAIRLLRKELGVTVEEKPKAREAELVKG